MFCVLQTPVILQEINDLLQPLLDAAAHSVHLACPEIHHALKSVEVDVTGRNSHMLAEQKWKKTTFSSDDLLESFHAQNVTEIIYFWTRFSTERDNFHESSPWMVSMLNPSPSVAKRNSGMRLRKKI